MKEQWDKAMSVMGREFTQAEQDAGWPASMKPRQLAGLQRPWSKSDKQAAHFCTRLLRRIEQACKDDLLLTATEDRPFTVQDKMFLGYKQRAFALGGTIGTSEPIFKTTTKTELKAVTVIAAPAFAAWLAAQPETPSEHIAAWFEAVGANTQDEAPPVPTPQPIVSAATQARNKRRDDFWSLIEDAQKDLADPFDTATIWLRLCEWAQAKEKKFPLMGFAGDIIQWRIDNLEDPKEFTRKMLSDRLGKQKKSQQRKPKPPLKRVK
jgi:hypothetical protein